jgi:hypothetical protein
MQAPGLKKTTVAHARWFFAFSLGFFEVSLRILRFRVKNFTRLLTTFNTDRKNNRKEFFVKQNRKKSDAKPKRARRWLFLLGVAGVALLVGISWKDYEKRRAQRVVAQLKKISGLHQDAVMGPDRWWLEKAPQPPTLEIYNLLEQKKVEIQNILRQYQDVSPETKKIAVRAREIYIRVFVNGRVTDLMVNGAPLPHSPQALKVCFIPREGAMQLGIVAPMWQTGEDAMIVPAMEIPYPMYVALLFHEFGHGLRHNRHDGGPEYPEHSDAYITEELEMHELGDTLLNRLSNGAYGARLDAIATRVRTGRRFDEALLAVTVEDLNALNAMCGCRGREVPGRMLQTQINLGVMFRWCDAHGVKKDQQIKIFRWFEEKIFK